MKDVLTFLIMLNIFQYLCVSNQHTVNLKPTHNVICQLYFNKAGKINEFLKFTNRS